MTEDEIFDPNEYFLNPRYPAQRRYEALRGYFLEGLNPKEAAERAGYSSSTFQSLVSNFKNGKIEFFVKPQYGPNKRQTSDYMKERIIELRKSNHSAYEIQKTVSDEGFETSIQTISRILKDEGFPKLPRRSKIELGISKKNTILPPNSKAIDFNKLDSYKFECQIGGIYYFIPYILKTGLYDLISSIPFPETSKLSKINSIFSILLLKLIGNERLSKISSYSDDSGFGFFAGLTILPKSTSISSYSYGIDKEATLHFLKNFIHNMKNACPQYYEGDTINLDFHSIPHYGDKSKMANNWVGAKHQSMKSALTLFAQDGQSRNLLYANTEIDKADESTEILNFVDYWVDVKGIIDQTLVFDSKLTKYTVLETLDSKEIKFITLRRRGKKIVEHANNIPESEWIKVDLKKERRKYSKFKMHESVIKLPKTSLEVRQVIFKDHGRQQPTFLITNNFEIELETLALQYANRWLIENKFAEIVDFFNLNSLSSPLMIRIYFDVVLTIIADTLYRLLAKDLKKFELCTPKTIFSDFINCRCIGEVKGDEIIIKMKKKATTPIFKSNSIYQESYPIPWLGNKKLRFEWIT